MHCPDQLETVAEVPRAEILAVERAIARMPKLTRDVFFMHRFDGLNYPSIAQLLGISESQVERQIVITLATIRQAREKFARRRRWPFL